MIRVAEIQHAVAQHYGLTLADIRSTSRQKRLVRPRQIAMYLARRMTTRSYPEIGLSFHRDHSTIMYAEKHVDWLREVDPDIATDVFLIANGLFAGCKGERTREIAAEVKTCSFVATGPDWLSDTFA